MNERKTIFKALVGSHNYNLNTHDSDMDYKVFVLPTFEDLYKGTMYSKSVIGATEDNDIHDVRKLVDLFFKANVNFLEVLYSKDFRIFGNEIERVYIEAILFYRTDIVKMNLPYLFNSCGGMHINKMNNLTKGTEGTQHLVQKFGYDTKQAQHAYRILNFIVRFAETDFQDFKYAMTYTGDDLKQMLDIKNGVFTEEQFRNFVKNYHDTNFLPKKDIYHKQQTNTTMKLTLENTIMNLVKYGIK